MGVVSAAPNMGVRLLTKGLSNPLDPPLSGSGFRRGGFEASGAVAASSGVAAENGFQIGGEKGERIRQVTVCG